VLRLGNACMEFLTRARNARHLSALAALAARIGTVIGAIEG
jgi:hypothetical protein